MISAVVALVLQASVIEAPAEASSGALRVSQGQVMTWWSEGKRGGQIMALVDNTGTEQDRIVSITTPLGSVTDLGVYPVVNGRGDRAPDGDLTIAPGRTGVLAELTDLTSPGGPPVSTTLVIVFEKAGEVSVEAEPVGPAPPPPPPSSR